MSILIASRIWDNGDPKLTGSRLVVLLCLAEYANDSGDCFPSIEKLATRARLSKVSVMTHLAELEALGYLRIERRQGAHNVYRITPEPAPTPSEVTFRKSGNIANLKTSQDSATGKADLTSQDSATGAAETSQATLTTTSQATLTTPVKPPLPEPSINRQLNRQVPKPAFIPIPSFQHSSGNGYKAAAEMQARNGKLGPELRVPLANMLLKIAGLNHLADVEEDNKLLCEAHDIAIEVYGIGYKTEDDLMAAEDDWYARDFRGQKGDRPTLAQFRKYAATYKAGKRVAPAPPAAEVWGTPA